MSAGLFCQRQGLTVERVFVEEGESAKTVNRPEFQKLLLYCRENKKKIGYVVVYSLSRFSRHTTDHHQIKALLSGFGVKLRSATEPIDDSSSGKFIESMIAAVAQFDNDQRSERTVAGMKAASLEGRWTFPAPIGYCNVTTNGSCSLEQDPARAPLIRMAFELFASGQFDQEQVLRKVTAQGLRTRRGKKLSRQSFSALLRKPIYTGRISLSCWEIDRTGNFAPIVSEMFSFELRRFLLAEECRRCPIKRSTLISHCDILCDVPIAANH